MARGLSRLTAELTGTASPGTTPRCWFEPGVIYAVVGDDAGGEGYGYGYQPTGDPFITVTWRNTEVPASYLSTYAPAVGDVVLMLIQPPGPPVVLSRLIGPEVPSNG